MLFRRHKGRHVAPSRTRLTAAGVLVAAGVMLSLLVSGCGGVSLADPVASSPVPAAASPQAKPSPAAGDGTIAFGKSARFDSGVTVTVAAPVRYTVASTAAGWQPGQRGYKIKVTIANSGSEVFNTALFTMAASSGPDGQQAERLFDSASGIGDFEGVIPPGGRKTATVGFAVDAAAVGACVVEVRPDFSGEVAVFKGTIR